MMGVAGTGDEGRAVYVYRQDPVQWVERVRFDLVTKRETVLDRMSTRRADPRYMLVHSFGLPGERWRARWDGFVHWIEVRPESGGEWKQLFKFRMEINDADGSTTFWTFTRDGNSIVYHDTDSEGKHALFRVAAGGGEPERLGDFPARAGSYGSLDFTPDGHTLIAAIGDYVVPEVWSIENFVPRRR
jgi:Tol biopolymer transport system component